MYRRSAALVILMLASAVLVTLAEKVDLYTSKFDYIDVDAILSNSRLRTQYLNCYLSKGPCVTPDAKFFKEKFPEALVTKCKKCTEKQKEFFEKATEWYIENEPDTWNAIVTKTIENIKKGQ